MKLTGKAKKSFEEWYISTIEMVEMESIDDSFDINGFYDLPLSMQFGVIQDWADSIGFSLIINWNWTVRRYYILLRDKDKGEKICNVGQYFTMTEARNAAIEKLNQIVNEG